MWKVLAPLIILVIILMIQLQVSESFTTGSGSSRTSTDASGNTTDASGNQITTPSAKTTISLSLADLLTLFKVTAPAPVPVPAPVPAPAPTPTTSTTMIQDETTPSEFYNKIRPQLLNDIIGITNTNMSGSPYEPAGPLPCDAPISDSAAQGAELQNVLKDYVKRDEVPCYGCTL